MTPTARELLDSIHRYEARCTAESALAARVEKVLALHEPPSDSTDWDQGWLACLEKVLHTLDGEE